MWNETNGTKGIMDVQGDSKCRGGEIGSGWVYVMQRTFWVENI